MDKKTEKIVQNKTNNSNVIKNEKKNRKKSMGNIFFIIILIIIAIIIGISIGYILFSDKNNIENKNTQNTVEENSSIKNENINTESNNQINNSNDLKYAEEYMKIIEQVEIDYPESNITCDLIYFNNDNIPDLVIGLSNYWVSLYIYENGKIYNPIDEWPYGIAGNTGYKYIEKQEIVLNNNSDFAGGVITKSVLILNANNEFDEISSTGKGADIESTDPMYEEIQKYLKEIEGYYYNDKKISEQEYNDRLKALSIDDTTSKLLNGNKTITEIKNILKEI